MKKIRLKNKKEIIIREAEKKDASKLIEYVKKVADETDFLTFSGNEFHKTIEEEEEIIEKHRLAKNQIFILAKLNDQIIGILNVGSSKKKRLEHIGEFGVSVLKDYWNIGVGTYLMSAMIDWAKESRVIKKINLKVSTTNKAGINLYKKFDFEIEGLIRRDLFVNNEYFDTFHMGLLIE